MTLYETGLDIATRAHAKQVRNRSGEPYIEHCKRVAAQFSDDYTMAIAVMHDVIEDHPGFEQEIGYRFQGMMLRDLRQLRRREGETYYDYVMRICREGSITTKLIKLSDLSDNLRDRPDGDKADKYRFAHHLIKESLRSDL